MRRLTTLLLFFALGTTAAMALSGCGAIAQKASETAIEKATGVKVDKNSGTISATDKEGNTTQLSSKKGNYPDGFPSDFPKYEGTIETALKSTVNGKDTFSVIIKTPDSAKDVFDFYVAELEKNGWAIDQKMDGTTSDTAYASITSTKGDLGGGVTLSRDNSANETAIMVSVNPK